MKDSPLLLQQIDALQLSIKHLKNENNRLKVRCGEAPRPAVGPRSAEGVPVGPGVLDPGAQVCCVWGGGAGEEGGQGMGWRGGAGRPVQLAGGAGRPP